MPPAKATLRTLSNGAVVMRVKVSHMLTHYDLVSAALFALKEGETEVTRESCVKYAKRLLREKGVDGLIEVYNTSHPSRRDEGSGIIDKLFPEMKPVPRRTPAHKVPRLRLA